MRCIVGVGRARGLDATLGGDVRQAAAGLRAGSRLAGVTADLLDTAGNG